MPTFFGDVIQWKTLYTMLKVRVGRPRKKRLKHGAWEKWWLRENLPTVPEAAVVNISITHFFYTKLHIWPRRDTVGKTFLCTPSLQAVKGTVAWEDFWSIQSLLVWKKEQLQENFCLWPNINRGRAWYCPFIATAPVNDYFLSVYLNLKSCENLDSRWL
jgi:hypothetical protein